jgi:two-component sensor histidine kinase
MLAAALVVPLIAFAALAVYRYAQAEQVRVEQEAVRIASLTGLLVDAELKQLIAKLEGLSASSALSRDDLQGFHAEAKLLTNGRDETIILRDMGVHQFFNSQLPFDARLPDGPAFSLEERNGYAHGRPYVSDVYLSPRNREPRIVIVLPILRDGSPKYVVGLTVPTSRVLSAFLPAVPPGYVVGVGDRAGAYVTRSERHEEFTGKPGLPDYVKQVLAKSGSFRTSNFERQEILAGYYRSELSGWFYTANIPTERLQAPLKTSLVKLAVIGAAALVVSGYLALLFSQGITAAARGLAKGAQALGAAGEVNPVTSKIAEFALISDALVAASNAIAERSRERKRSEAQRELLVNELNHRVKNSLALAQSIATQTLRSAPSISEARSALSRRLVSLGRTHDILTRENWESASLAEIVANAADVYGAPDRITSEGPVARLSPARSLSMSLVLHELMTNSSKYGALSSDNGTVSIRWWNLVEPDKHARLFLKFEEVGGPRVSHPEHRGFGSRLFAASFASPEEGKLAISYRPSGVICEIEIQSEPS